MDAAPDTKWNELFAERASELSQFELSLIVANNAFEQWVARCGAAAGGVGMSSNELFILHMISHNNRKKRTSDICFALKIEDSHTVSYVVRKLVKSELVLGERVGKEIFYSPTEAGRRLIERYAMIRRRCLIKSLAILNDEEMDLAALSDLLRALSGFYEQAARRAETSP